MKKGIGLKLFLVASIGLVLVARTGGSAPLAPDKLPEPVANTFKTMFPNGTIAKLDVEEEDGVMVYDFEFSAGGREKEADIAGDGTMIESTLVVAAKDIPAPAMKTIKRTAKGAKLGRMEWLETFYELKDGKIIKLPKSEIHYAVEMSRGDQKAEVFVDPAGKVTEAPEWVSAKPVEPKSEGKTGK